MALSLPAARLRTRLAALGTSLCGPVAAPHGLSTACGLSTARGRRGSSWYTSTTDSGVCNGSSWYRTISTRVGWVEIRS